MSELTAPEANFYFAEAEDCRKNANRYLYGAVMKLVGFGGLTVIAHETVGRMLPDTAADKILKVGFAATAITAFSDAASSAQERIYALFSEQEARALIEG
jgi:hypothetical protein